MKYEEYRARRHFTKQELVAISWGTLVEDPPCEEFGVLPAPPFLMFDRVTDLTSEGLKGTIAAEQDVRFDDWFFQCHFRLDPVQPGCLGVDAIWQLLGLYCSVRGSRGIGRALGCKEVEFFGQIRPHDKLVRYEIDVRRYAELRARGTAVAVGTGRVFVDGEHIYTITDAKVGLFEGIKYGDYPAQSERSRGGLMNRSGGAVPATERGASRADPKERVVPALTPDQVLALVPQQAPFRFLDQILEIDEQAITGTYTFKPDETFYAGHFPGMPVTPGVILLEAMAQTGVVALGIYLKALEVDDQELRRWRSVFTDAQVEFLAAVLPGERIICRGERVFWRRNKLRSKVDMTRDDGRLVASCTLSGLGVRSG